MISIVWSKNVDKSNTKYYDVVIKWLNDHVYDYYQLWSTIKQLL